MLSIISARETANDIHHQVVETFYAWVKKMGMTATIKKENELHAHDMKDKDLCISVGKLAPHPAGGDSTFLKSAGIIDNNEQPILGINSDPSRRTGALLNECLQLDRIDEQVPEILRGLQARDYKEFYRNRALFSCENQVTKALTQKLCLNEVFAAEKDVSCTSMYRIIVDDRDMGKFKSSGIIIATGTGSSGWLYSARQVTEHDVGTIQTILGVEENPDLVKLRALTISGEQEPF